MQSRLLTADKPLPLVLEPGSEPNDSFEALVSFCRSERAWLDARLCGHGALLFRGFALDDARQFKALAEAVTPELTDADHEQRVELAAWTMMAHSLLNLELAKVRR